MCKVQYEYKLHYIYDNQHKPNYHLPAFIWIFNLAPLNFKMITMDVNRYNIHNKCNDHQLVPNPVFNSVPNSLTSKISKNYKYIANRSIAPVLLAQVSLIKALLM